LGAEKGKLTAPGKKYMVDLVCLISTLSALRLCFLAFAKLALFGARNALVEGDTKVAAAWGGSK
jgi:hypothetical protein